MVETRGREGACYHSPRFDVPVGASEGWEAAVLDHFQSLVSAVCVKLRAGVGGGDEATGGSTYTLDVWPGHPLENEARGLLSDVREQANGLRDRIDAHNSTHGAPPELSPVVFYVGQYVKADERSDDEG